MSSIDSSLNKLGGIQGLQQPQQSPSKKIDVKGPSFEEVLKNNISKEAGSSIANGVNKLKFSNHALERIQSRGIQINPEQMQKLESAVSRAEAKGAKETLVLMGDSALIVNIKNKTVVTAMDQNRMKDNVFTNIDSTVIL